MGILNQMVELARAGFTKEEILKLMQTETPAPAGNPAPVSDHTTAEGAKGPAGVTPPKAENVGTPDILAEMRKMIGEMQAANVAASQQPKEMTVDDVVAMIVNPDGGEK